MKGRIALAVLIAASIGGAGSALAKGHKAAHPAVSCKAVREALAGGKSKEDVAAEMKTSVATVERCQANAGKTHHGKKK